jgi:hypothetical protein
MQGQANLSHPLGDTGRHPAGLGLAAAVHHGIVGVPLEHHLRAARDSHMSNA